MVIGQIKRKRGGVRVGAGRKPMPLTLRARGIVDQVLGLRPQLELAEIKAIALALLRSCRSL